MLQKECQDTDWKLQNDKYIITGFIQEDSYAYICQCVWKYVEIDFKDGYQTANHTYLWVR